MRQLTEDERAFAEIFVSYVRDAASVEGIEMEPDDITIAIVAALTVRAASGEALSEIRLRSLAFQFVGKLPKRKR